MNSTSEPLLTITRTPFTLPMSDGEILHCDARYPSESTGKLPVVLFSHGFKGFKDWGSIPHICESLAAHGFYVISFNFSHNGVEDSSMEFTQLDRFQHNTFSREVRELREVIDGVESGAFPEAERIHAGAIGLLGHSRGGGISILVASADARVRSLAVWGSVADFNRYSEAQRRRWRENGVFETKNMRTGQIMRLDVELLNDLEQNAETLDIGRAAAKLGKPFLILHGEQDLSVRIEDGQQLASLADPALTEFERIPKTNHTFGAVHPFEGSNSTLDWAINRTATFLDHTLKPG